VHVSTTTGKFKASFDEVRDCQDQVRERLVGEANDRGRPMTAAQLDRLDEHHRAEARAFLSREELEPLGEAPAPREEIDPDSEPDPGAKPDITAGDAAAVLKLRKKLKERAAAGEKGLTPGAAGDIRAALESQQGGASEEMRGLLDSVEKDKAGKPSPETVKKLMEAAKSSRGRGMDLNLDAETQSGLEAAEKRLASPVPTIDKR
jgi:hypothetical protein